MDWQAWLDCAQQVELASPADQQIFGRQLGVAGNPAQRLTKSEIELRQQALTLSEIYASKACRGRAAIAAGNPYLRLSAEERKQTLKQAEQDAARFRQTYRFLRRALTSAKGLTRRDLLRAHEQLVPGHRLRNQPGRVGDSQSQVDAFIPPPPDQLARYLNDWLAFVNRRPVGGWLALAVSYAQLIHVHPFSDGNGRVARCLHLALAEPLGLSPLAISVVFCALIITGREEQMPAMSALRDGDAARYLRYWHQVVTWSYRYCGQLGADQTGLRNQAGTPPLQSTVDTPQVQLTALRDLVGQHVQGTRYQLS